MNGLANMYGTHLKGTTRYERQNGFLVSGSNRVWTGSTGCLDCEYLMKEKRISNTFWGEGRRCATHGNFWGDKYPHCTHIADNRICVPLMEEEGLQPEPEVDGAKLEKEWQEEEKKEGGEDK